MAGTGKALLVIDMQSGFFTDQGQPVYREEPLIANINTLIRTFREQNAPIIFIRHNEPDDLVKNSPEWRIDSRMNARNTDICVDKTTPDSFYNTGLENLLRQHGIETVFITGLQTDYCIDTTCRSAFAKHFSVILVRAAHSTCDNSYMSADQTIEYHQNILSRWFAEIMSISEVMNDIQY